MVEEPPSLSLGLTAASSIYCIYCRGRSPTARMSAVAWSIPISMQNSNETKAQSSLRKTDKRLEERHYNCQSIDPARLESDFLGN